MKKIIAIAAILALLAMPAWAGPAISKNGGGGAGTEASPVTKGWFTDAEFTNMPTVGGTSLSTTFQASLNAAGVVTMFGSGSCSGYLKSDGSCDTPSVGATTWDTITGTLSDNEDLQAALDDKVDVADAPDYTEPGSNGPLCRTGAGAVGACSNVTDTNYFQPTTTVAASRTVANKAEYVICTGTCSVTPLTPAAGIQLCVRNGPGVTTAITLANITDVYYEKTDHSGWQANANYKLVSGGAATDAICIVGYDSTHYAIMNSTGTWTHTAP